MTSATQDVTGINLSTLADGAVTFSVTLTDAAGAGNVTATATIDRELPAAVALSTSVAPAGATLDTPVAVLETVGPESTTGQYTYTLVPGADDNSSFTIPAGTDQLEAAGLLNAADTYTVLVKSTDALLNYIEQSFTITVGNPDPVSPTVSISPSSSATAIDATDVSIVAGQTAAGTSVGTLDTTGPIIGPVVNYTLVSGTGSTDNGSFQIVNGQLETTGKLTAGKTYTVRVRSSSTFLISEAMDLTGATGQNVLQVTLDPQLPSGFEQAAANAGLIALSYRATSGNWYPAVSANEEAHGSLAQPNYLGPAGSEASYANFWSSVTKANPSATLSDVVGSSGVDLQANAAWAAIDQPTGEYAVGVQVFTEQVITIKAT